MVGGNCKQRGADKRAVGVRRTRVLEAVPLNSSKHLLKKMSVPTVPVKLFYCNNTVVQIEFRVECDT